MLKNKLLKRSFAMFLAVTLGVTGSFAGLGTNVSEVKAAETKGSLATEVTGTTGSGATNASLLTNLPTKANAGKSRFTTSNYDATNGAIDTSNWGTSLMWDVDGSGNAYGNAVFAIPWSYKGYNNTETGKQGILFSKPSSKVVRDENAGTGYVLNLAPSQYDSEFAAIPGYATSGLKVDKVTDWTYEVVMQKADDAGTYMKTTMVQGSPFAYFEMVGTNTVTIDRTRQQQSEIVKMAEDGSMFVIRVNDPVDKEFTTGKYHDYYAFYAPAGTVWTTEDTSNGAFLITSIKATFPEGKSYFSVAAISEQMETESADNAIAIAESYKPYAYNFVTDTKAEYSYNEETHKLTTTYTYTVDKKAGSTADGTIMGILPHHYKNMSGNVSYMSHRIDTLRGEMKLLTGSSFTTELTFSGILPWLTDVEDTDTLSGYVDEYMAQFFPNGAMTESSFTVAGTGTGADTYWTGKALNRTSNVLAAAESVGDEENAELLLASLKAELANWFTASGANDNKYFYYEDEVGVLLGFPESFNSVDQINDHHFHYGYFIYTAAQVALRDPEWGKQYSGIVKELIDDIACATRNNADSRYPYLRNFAPYEGHSWASGHANFDDGNNQESSSEAINAWAGIILFGEAIGDKELRDLGIYLYTTEISAINNYWFDVDENVLPDYFRYYGQYDHFTQEPPANATPTFNQASMVWGSKFEYSTWFGAHPMLIQGINLLPMNPSSFYLSLRSDYILENWNIAKENAVKYNWSDHTTVWNDVWSAYIALADPVQADGYWTRNTVEEGESKAHTYQYIYSLKKAGKPDLSVLSNTTLSTCFINDAGQKTYVAYNPSDAEETVTFSDGKQVIVQPKTMETLVGGETQGDAQYTIQCYGKVLDEDGNETNEYVPIKTVTERANKGTQITVTAPSVSGYVFDESNSKNQLTGVVKEDGTLVLNAYYKKNTCNVIFNSNGGSAVETQTVKIGKTATKPANPTKDGYVFGGWYNGTDAFNFSQAVTENLVLTARWKQLVPNTNIPQRSDKGMERKDDDLVMYLKSSQPAASSVAFIKVVSSADEEVSTAGVGAVSSDIKPVVQNGEYVEFTIENGALTYADGYLAYWFNWDNSPTIVDVTQIPNVGEFTTADTTSYKVTFVSDNSEVGMQMILEGEKVYKPMNPVKEGYVFKGWYQGETVYNFDSAVTSDVTLTAKWEEYSETPGGGNEGNTGNETPGGGNEGNTGNETPGGGSGDDSENETPGTGNGSGNCTGTGTGNDSATQTEKEYTVTFDTAGGSAVDAQKVKAGEKVTKPADPVRDGYAFTGWYNGASLYDFNTGVTSDLTLTAGWDEVKVSKIKITGLSKKIAVTKKIKLTANITPENALNKGVKWTVSNKKYATVSKDGLVKFKKKAKNKTVTVTAEALDGSGVKAKYKIKVMPKAIKKITLKAEKTSVKAGKSVKIKASFSPSSGINKTVEWSVNNKKYATITKKGVLKTKKAGKGKKVKVTAKALDGSGKKKTITIKVK